MSPERLIERVFSRKCCKRGYYSYEFINKSVTTRATSVVEGRKEGIIGRSITAQVGRGRCDQRSWLRIAIFSRCLRSLPSQLWVVAPSLFIDEWKEPPGYPTELQEYIAYILYSGLFRCFGYPWPYYILPKALGPIPLSPNIVTRPCLIYLSEEGVPMGRVLTWKERYPAPCLPSEGRLTRGTCS